MTVPVTSETHIPSTVVIPGVPAQVTPVAPAVPTIPTVPVTPIPAAAVEPVVPEEVTEPLNTGNAALDTAVNVFTAMTKATDADLSRAAGNAIEYSNADLIDMVFIKERFGDHANQAVQLIKATIAEKDAIVARQTAEVHTLAGGKGNWDAAVSVYQTNAPEHIKAAVVALVDTGKTKEGTQMLLDFAVSQGLNPGAVSIQNPPNVPGGNGALGAAEFRVELNKLHAESGGRSLESGVYGDRYKDLMSRREAGRQLGR